MLNYTNLSAVWSIFDPLPSLSFNMKGVDSGCSRLNSNGRQGGRGGEGVRGGGHRRLAEKEVKEVKDER